ncbi:MAG: MerR family DNA-binding transcriptional regulator [Terriglobales bacterium]
MRIGELAKRGGVSVQAIRFYERRRLMLTSRVFVAHVRATADRF